MNDDELKKLWQQQPLREPPSATQFLAAMQTKSTQFRQTIATRDLGELIACAIVVIVFGFYYYRERTPMVRLGWGIIIAGSLFAAARLIYARRSNPPAPPGASIVESLRAELNSVRAQSRLLRSIFWWYLLPPGVGLLVATWGMPVGLGIKIPASLFFIALYAGIYWLNQRARANQLLPLEAQLQSLLRSAETGEPLDQTHAANLLPFALSNGADSHAKPVEFKVAFLQLALYGEIGFVGIWFFWTLSQQGEQILRDLARGSFHFLANVFSPYQLLLLLAFFLGGLIYSWLIQKMTLRAVGISPLGIHLARGLTFLTWDEIKEVRVLKFLNVRSLWLIRESGQKSIMPWTSLENPAALKAAVETHAPPNHPLRQHLSLLHLD